MSSVATSLSSATPLSAHSTHARCCSTGYPVLADPATGRTTCSCQLQTGVPAYLSRVPGLPGLPEAMYGHHGIASIAAMQRPSVGMYHNAFGVGDSRLLKAAPPSSHMHYDAMMAASPYSYYPGFDINAVRRKNATRESTSALKAWLFQHRKNPYPTKAEKVMLAIISQMTLTQVSTWFANARRRLKKDRKNGENGDLELDDIDVDDKKSVTDSMSGRLSDSDYEVASVSADNSRVLTDLSDISDAEEQMTTSQKPAKKCVQRLFSPDTRSELFMDRLMSPNDSVSSTSSGFSPKLSNSDSVFAEENQVPVKTKDAKDFGANSKTGTAVLNSGVVSQQAKISQPQTKAKIWSIASIIG